MTKDLLDPRSAEVYLNAGGPTRSRSDSSLALESDRASSIVPVGRKPHKLILCFDGTGNKFHGDESDSNILKIFRMLDRTADDQYHYYQPGIGTYVISTALTRTSTAARIKSWYQKAKDSAVGSSFDQHVVGGYRFLMRFYNTGDEIYIFGFSRGAYIARFLAEMLDHIGLLCHGNEEMVSFAWKAFSQWQCRPGGGGKRDKKSLEEERKKHELYQFMKGFRETFSRPVGRIRFLGLFDTVNSVPRFETAWMQRSKFPYTARSSAKVIRHAVSIDERRAKFRQDLIYQHHMRKHKKDHHDLQASLHNHLHEHWEHLGGLFEEHLPGNQDDPEAIAPPGDAEKNRQDNQQENREDNGQEREKENEQANEGANDEENGQSKEGQESREMRGRSSSNDPTASQCNTGTHYAPYRPRSKSPQWRRRASSACCRAAVPETFETAEDPLDERDTQDIDEVWFAGGHGDIGGGWHLEPEGKNASHVPLVWMVREAMRAGLPFDLDKVEEMDCLDVFNDYNLAAFNKMAGGDNPRPQITVNRGCSGDEDVVEPLSPGNEEDDDLAARTAFRALVHDAHCAKIHDSLAYGGGLGFLSVTAWKLMEWLPFRRMDLQADGSWKPISWPLPRGEVRDIPDDVRVHGSVIRRMQTHPTYRPGNLIIGGGGRGTRIAPDAYGMGEWVCVAEEGDPIGEIWVRKGKPPGFEAFIKTKKSRTFGRRKESKIGEENGGKNGEMPSTTETSRQSQA